jgi:hypothetical protein
MVTTQEELQACFDQTLETGDFAPVIAGLKELTGVKSVHQFTLDYFEQLRINAVPNHPFYITKWAELGKHCYTYYKLFRLWDANKEPIAGYFPAINIAGSIGSLEFFLMLETGKVVVMHSDEMTEIADELFKGSRSRLSNDIGKRSIYSAHQFVAIKRAFADIPDEKLKELDPKEFFTKLADALGWQMKNLYFYRNHSSFEWMNGISEVNDALFKELAGK